MIDGVELHHGTADQLLERGVLERLFDDTPLSFDRASRTVRLRSGE